MGLFSAKTVKKEDYYTASQMQLVWARFKKKRSAMVAAGFLVFFILCGVFAAFIGPYEPTAAGRNADYTNGAPQVPQFCDDNGCSLVPFIHKVERYRGMDTNFRWVTRQTDERNYMTFLPKVEPYRMLGIPMEHRLFGVEEGFIHLFGTDAAGKDIFSRTLHAIGISLAVGTIGVLISFVLALIIGGVAGYFGGWVDTVLQALMDTVKTTPTIPLFMALAAFIPDEWSAEMRFAFISMILGFLGWGTLARRIRTHVLAERTADYVLAAKLSSAGPAHIIGRHLLPSFTSYIIVDLVISFPYMVLAETSLSFIGLGLKDPVNSLGVLLQNVTKVDVLLNYHWYFIPVPIFVAIVLAFVFVGDGLRDAADPYSERH
ncbi:ABC transporter permease [Pseudovibrio exalbescens]|uniref:ABC transporter permease n=1 Tax=Pseudovibrio exalbescens TaxID=197461 RepID=UPI002365030D|nr:ABC transporter permease [Pseudovibrio exalbescens]MDD7911445.1 ABC transporter permease [Pseudovibrio exalbescens]